MKITTSWIEFLGTVNDDPYIAIWEIIRKIDTSTIELNNPFIEDSEDYADWESITAAMVVIDQIIDGAELDLPKVILNNKLPEQNDDEFRASLDRCDVLKSHIEDTVKQRQAQQTMDAVSGFSDKFSEKRYHFTEGDLERIQTLINELREYIRDTDKFDEAHKRRILKRLEKLQLELHKHMSDISVFYTLMGDFGIALGKFGNDAKPFTDRIREIMRLAWDAEARAAELPSNSTLNITTGSDSDTEE